MAGILLHILLSDEMETLSQPSWNAFFCLAAGRDREVYYDVWVNKTFKTFKMSHQMGESGLSSLAHPCIAQRRPRAVGGENASSRCAFPGAGI
jgi:hypothetical protein